jgi:3-hydroxypropanoate dehydrogenase
VPYQIGKIMLDRATIATLFTEARSHNVWTDRPVTDAQLRALYELFKWGPTSANSSPARIIFVKSAGAREKLVQCMDPGNRAKVSAAPVTAIIGMDLEFYEKLPALFPQVDARSWFAGKPAVIEATAFRNSSLQGAYLILAARALGLDCGPMSGFDVERVTAEFFPGTAVRANFVCSLGYGELEQLHPRLPRLAFDEACRID